MKALILEDSKERVKLFKKHWEKGNDLYFFDSVEDAKKALEVLGPFDLIMLDHDLDDRVYVDSDEPNTGYQLAKYIAENNIETEVITHTLNPCGAKNIIGVLPKAKHIPFISLFK